MKYEAKRVVNGLHCVAFGNTQHEADESVEHTARAIRENRPEVGFTARPRGSSVKPKMIVAVDRSDSVRVQFEGDDEQHNWGDCEYA